MQAVGIDLYGTVVHICSFVEAKGRSLYFAVGTCAVASTSEAGEVDLSDKMSQEAVPLQGSDLQEGHQKPPRNDSSVCCERVLRLVKHGEVISRALAVVICQYTLSHFRLHGMFQLGRCGLLAHCNPSNDQDVKRWVQHSLTAVPGRLSEQTSFHLQVKSRSEGRPVNHQLRCSTRYVHHLQRDSTSCISGPRPKPLLASPPPVPEPMQDVSENVGPQAEASGGFSCHLSGALRTMALQESLSG